MIKGNIQHENRYCCYGYPGCSCYDWSSASCYHYCWRNRPAARDLSGFTPFYNVPTGFIFL